MTTRMTSTHCTSTIAWRFTTCVPTSTSTEGTWCLTFLYTSSTLTLAQVRALSALHSRPSSWHPCGCCLFDLISSFYLFAFLLSVFLFPFFHLSDEQQPELNKKIMENLCDSATNGCEGTAPTTSSTYPQVMSPTAMTSTSSRTHRSPSPSRSLPRTRTWMT